MPNQRILFVAPSPLGDALLTTGVLDHMIASNPLARFTVVCSPLNAPLFRAAPRLEKLIELTKERYGLHWLKAFASLAGPHWDVLVDFRNVGIFRLLRVRSAHRATARDFSIHKVEENAHVIGAPPCDPHLWLDDKARAEADALMPAGIRILGFGPISSSPFKEWLPDRFAELARRLTASGAALDGAAIAIFAAAHERARAERVLALMPPGQTLDLIGKTDALGAAACLGKLDLYVGNDSGLMHLAAAAGTPTVGLFGTGWPAVYRPWGRRTAYVARLIDRSPDELRRLPLDQMPGVAMQGIDVAEVEAAALSLLGQGELR